MRTNSLVASLLLVLAIIAPGKLAAQSDPMEFPDVKAVQILPQANNTFDFAVTITSPYDTAQKYADGFRVTGADGSVFGEFKLTHDHATEQPFTRTLTGIAIPASVREVIVPARDQKNGYGGNFVKLALPGR